MPSCARVCATLLLATTRWRCADVASDELLKAATQVTTREQMAEIATVSSGDPEIGAKIAEALDEIGQDGVISVEKSTKFGIDLEVKKGMLFDRGFISPYMADDMGSMTGELEQPYILITDQRLADNFKDVVPVLEEVMQSGHPLLIVADDVRGESLNSLLMNRQKGTLISAAVMCPGAEERRKAELEDMAILTAGRRQEEHARPRCKRADHEEPHAHHRRQGQAGGH